MLGAGPHGQTSVGLEGATSYGSIPKYTANVHVDFRSLKRSLSYSVTALFSLCPGFQIGRGGWRAFGSNKGRSRPRPARWWHDRLEQVFAASRWNLREEAGPQGRASWRLCPGILGSQPLQRVLCPKAAQKWQDCHTWRNDADEISVPSPVTSGHAAPPRLWRCTNPQTWTSPGGRPAGGRH